MDFVNLIINTVSEHIKASGVSAGLILFVVLFILKVQEDEDRESHRKDDED